MSGELSGSRDYHFIVPINVAWVLRRETQSGHQLNETMIVLHGNIMGDCPGGFCEYLLQFSEVLTVLLLADGFIFLVTLIPPLFSWKNKKPDSKNRIFFAVFSCLTFYFWLSVVALNSLYCFGFLSYAGPCNSSAGSPASALGWPFTTVISVKKKNYIYELFIFPWRQITGLTWIYQT